jgi:hypothetical protein
MWCVVGLQSVMFSKYYYKRISQDKHVQASMFGILYCIRKKKKTFQNYAMFFVFVVSKKGLIFELQIYTDFPCYYK